ncbi:nitrous oxide reductase accessory protein NosL [Sphingobacterium humi]|uniref:nitrous oxide reductase accessory protein NosL n=1 Tax=Sphingobacterium humi TaxID=1796905 RepID=UPI001BAE60D9|nr:nitrous oxide reductase accessory protein NosL [Sphingobacterium humi]
MKYRLTIRFTLFFLLVSAFFLQSCQSQTGPKPIKYGADQCAFCKMTVSDPRFGTQILTKKGRAYNFDDVQCMIAYVKGNKITAEEVGKYYLPDYISNKLLDAEGLFYLKSEELKSPMRGNIAAFATRADLEKVQAEMGGEVLTWKDLWK